MTKQRVQKNAANPTTRDINAGQRASLALTLRSQGHKYEDIARQCGYGSAGAAHKAVQRELHRAVVTNVDELRRVEMHGLAMLEAKCWERLEDKKHENWMLQAVDRILAIKERRARLMGLDTPVDAAIAANMVVIREVPAGLLGEVSRE